MGSEPEQEYVLGTQDDELTRLGFQHRVWSEQAFALWERAGFAPGRTILDVGSGPGYAAVDLAHLVGPTGRVIAVDASARFLAFLSRRLETVGIQHVETKVGDVQELQLPAESIDGAYARWVLCFVPDPEKVVASVARALRPGGVFAVQDYFNYASLTLAPRSPIFDRVVQAVSKSWKMRGGDDDVAGRLPAIMSRQGLRVQEIKPILRVARPGTALWHWPASFFHNFVPKLVEMGLLTRNEQTAFERDWAERSQDPSTFFVTPPVFELLAVKES